MNKKIVKLKESDIERLVMKIIKEEEDSKTGTLTKHPAYNIIDKLEERLEDLKKDFKDNIANAVSGEDGYHSDIDKFSSEFTNFIGKLEKLKQKINDQQISEKSKEKQLKEKQLREKQMRQHQMRERARKEGRNYSY